MTTDSRSMPWPLVVLATSVIATFLLSLMLGPLSLSPYRVAEILLQAVGRGSETLPAYEVATVTAIRLPRALTALVVGAALAGAGAVLQGLTRNPLVEPALIGVSSGAAVGAACVIVLGGALVWLPAAAFAAALMVTLGLMSLAHGSGHLPAANLLLAGVAVNALAASILGVLTVVADDTALRTLTFWMFGSLARTGWHELALLLPLVGACLLLMLREQRLLDVLALGDGVAGHLGFDVEKSRQRLIVVIALAVGASVAYTGIIAFVGLVVPHLVRLLLGAQHRLLLPGSMLLGSALTLLADTIGRLAVAPAELPIGVITSLCGAPFFIGLLWWRRQQVGTA